MKYSEITYTYNGGDTVFSIPFEYIKKEFIYVYINNKLLENDYIIDTQTIIINKPIELESKVTIQRKTTLYKLVDFTNRNNLKSFDLNLAFTQILHIMQEEQDSFNEIMPQTPDGNWNALNKKITNLAPAVNDTDAVRKDQIVTLTYEGIDELENNVKELLVSTEKKIEKGQPNGYPTLNENCLIPREQLSVNDFAKCCVNSGSVDEYGEPNLMKYNAETKTVTVKAPFVYTNIDGNTFKVSKDLSITIDTASANLFRIFVNRNSAGEFYLEALANNVYIQKIPPNNAVENDIFINTSVAPASQTRLIQNIWKHDEAVEIGSIRGIETGGGGGACCNQLPECKSGQLYHIR